MVNYREILRLLDLEYTQRDIARSIHCSRNTVRDVQYLSKDLGIRWPLDDNVTNKDIAKLFHPDLYGAARSWNSEALQLPTKCSCNHLHFWSATFYIFILQ